MPPNSDLLEPLVQEETEESTREKKGFSPIIAVCYTVNFLVGTGFLTLPWAFVQGGLLLSAILLFICTGITDFTKDFLLEAMARAEAVVELDDGVEKDDEEGEREVGADEEPLIIKERKFEIADLCRVFIGERATVAYTAILAFGQFMTLWAYTVVFITTLEDEAPGTGDKNTDYYIFTLIFACIVVPLSCLELKEQITYQVTLSICRMFMLLLMISTTLIYPDDFREKQYDPVTNPFLTAPLFNFAGLSLSLPSIIFALRFQVAIPSISDIVTDKRQLSGIFRSTFIFCAISYTLVGIMVPLATGQTVAQSANVMWSNFRGGTGELNDEGEYINVAFWARAVSFFVVTFPAIDVISAFPLNAIVLGNNLLDTFYGEESHGVSTNRKRVIIFRLISSIPPVFGTLFVRKLGIVTDYSGTLFLILMFCYTSVIYLYSKREKGTTKETCYKSWGTNDPTAIFVFWFGAVMFVYLVVDYSING